MKLKKFFVLFATYGLFYLNIEVCFRALLHQMPSYQYASLMGYVSLWMFPIGGLLGIILGNINQLKIMKKVNYFWQSIISAVFILAVEFVAGIVLNIWLGLNIWTYSDMPFNIMGQICLPFGILWFLLAPFVFWLDDTIEFYWYGQGEAYNLLELYIKVFTCK